MLPDLPQRTFSTYEFAISASDEFQPICVLALETRIASMMGPARDGSGSQLTPVKCIFLVSEAAQWYVCRYLRVHYRQGSANDIQLKRPTARLLRPIRPLHHHPRPTGMDF